MKQIPLSKGKVAIIDDEWFAELAQFSWHVNSNGYAVRQERVPGSRSPKTVRMHRVIIGATDGELVDHINRNVLDNRRSNLRISDKSQNACNRGKQRNNTSGYKGVTPKVIRGGVRYVAQIRINGKKTYLGTRDSAKEAYVLYREACLQLHGEFALP